MIRTSEGTKFLVAALGEFHKAEVSVPKTAANPFFKSKYADLWTIKSQCDPVLNEAGLVVTQFPGISEGGTPTLITRLCHTSGEFMEAETPLKLPKDDPQAQGSSITYMRRYAYCAVLGIVADPDDDAEGAMQRGKTKPAKRAFVTQPLDPTESVVQEALTAHADGPADPATPKQLSYLRALIRDGGLADADVEILVNTHYPTWPGDVAKLSKGQARALIEALK